MRLGLPPIAAMSFLLLSTRPAQGGLSDSDSSDLEVILILGIGLILTSLVLYLVFRAFRGQSGRNAPRSRVVANSKPNSFVWLWTSSLLELKRNLNFKFNFRD